VLRAASAVAVGDVWVVFQPHTTHRTAALLRDFARAFGDAQHALILPIYVPSGRELSASAVTSADLAAAISAAGHPDARQVDSFDAAEDIIRREVQPGAMVITMGAGDVTRLADRLADTLAR
jgi:UDP-N-acetylmuramate--alanine ligase